MDTLDEKISMEMTMSDEAYGYLPVITRENLKTKKEAYRLLLGTWKIINPRLIQVNVEATFEIPNNPKYYREEKEKIAEVDMLAIKKTISNLKENFSEYRHLVLVGEIHTHPVQQKEINSNDRPWHLSPGDKSSLTSQYKCGNIDPSQPFLLGVAGATEDGKTGYAFYRLIKKNKKYHIRPVEWK